MTERDGMTYGESGVDTDRAASALKGLAACIVETHRFRDHAAIGRPVRGLGYYANVIDMGGGQGLAVAADGVGTKLLVAELLGKYDTVGIDCIAMNVNDLICVGAEPVAMLDYIAVGKADDAILAQVGAGLLEGARQCEITIPGGELAQVKEMLRGHGKTEGFDLVGTAIGTVALDSILWGQDVVPGDTVVGLASSGIHSNGFTLARKVLAPNPDDFHRHDQDFGRTVGEELLEPTALYVALAKDLFKQSVPLHALCHITGDGYMNLTRVEAPVGFDLTDFPTPHAVFQTIQSRGHITTAEMYTVFNMGIGLCAILPDDHADRVIATAEKHGYAARRLGTVTGDAGVVRIPQHGLTSRDGHLVAE
ncbi:MAG: phosphoribosylformylglycinamidine cyclo-ligase [Planctomycetes bacterium]|nr:phosphoribosylformylglycinamidine cyclo-ligase [Planctomycetota bacterium]